MSGPAEQQLQENQARQRTETAKMAPNAANAINFFNSTAFDARVNSLINEWHVPGLSLTLIHEQELHSKAFGFATLQPSKNCTPDTLFDIASASKSTTAGAVALFVDDEENYPHVQWDTPMSKLLPDDFVMADESYTNNVTVEDILSHRSGLPSHDNFYFSSRSSHPDDPRSVTRNLRNLPVSIPIRTKEQYNNSLYTVASYLVEKLSKKSFEEFLHERFWKPLGMSSTNLQPDTTREVGLGDRMSKPYYWKEDNQTYQTLIYEQTPEAQGAGSIWTSSKDYALWVKAIMNKEAPITEEIYKGLIKPRIFSNPDDDDLDPFCSWQGYAAGLESYFYRGYQIVQHDGLISGFSSVHFFFPDFKVGGVILGNSENAGTVGSGILVKEFMDEILEIPASDRTDWNARQHKANDEYEENKKESDEKLRKELSTNNDGVAEDLKLPLGNYVGEYWNIGYKEMVVQVKDGRLYIDASDRTMAFSLDMDHISDNTYFIGTLYDVLAADEEVEKLKVEFRFDADNKAVRMGIHLEPDLDGQLIWFDRVQQSPEGQQQKVVVR